MMIAPRLSPLVAGLASLLTLASPMVASAQASQVQISGAVDLGVRHVKNSAGTLTSQISGGNSSSRLVVRGRETLGNGWEAGFWLEGLINADSGTAGSSGMFWDRQSTVSLKSPYGELRLGRDWNPVFTSWALTDPFVVLGVGGQTALISAASTTAVSRAFGAGVNTISRNHNAVSYFLPALGGVYGQVMLAPSENGNATGSYRYNSARLGYAGKGFDVVAYYGGTRIDATRSTFGQMGVAGSYDFGSFKLQGNHTQTSYRGSKHALTLIGVRVRVGTGEIKASLARADQSGVDAAGGSINANDATLFGVGYVHPLSKRTVVYTNYARITNKGNATYGVAGGLAGVRPGSGSNGFEVGLRHSF